MLSWVVTFLIIALVASLLGFGGIAGASIEIAKIVFFVAIVLFLISAVVGLSRRRGGFDVCHSGSSGLREENASNKL